MRTGMLRHEQQFRMKRGNWRHTVKIQLWLGHLAKMDFPLRLLLFLYGWRLKKKIQQKFSHNVLQLLLPDSESRSSSRGKNENIIYFLKWELIFIHKTDYTLFRYVWECRWISIMNLFYLKWNSSLFVTSFILARGKK